MLHNHFTLRNGSNPLVGDGMGHAFANDKSGQQFAPMCIAAVLVAIAVLSGAASARPGTRAAVPPKAVLLQKTPVCQMNCSQYPRGPIPPGLIGNPFFVLPPLSLPLVDHHVVGAPAP